MTAEPWLYGIAIAAAVLAPLVAFAARRLVESRARPADGDGAGDGGGHERRDVRADGAVECPSCGTENEPDYRFCRWCVSELPGGAAGGHRPAAAFGRGIL